MLKGSSIYYVRNGGGVKTPYAFPISVMIKKCVQGGEGGQIWPKNAYIINGRPLIATL